MEAPKKMWLQKYEDHACDGSHEDMIHEEQVTWCEDRINRCDVEYTRSDLIKPLVEAAKPFIKVSEHFDYAGNVHKDTDRYDVWVTVGDILRLRQALAKLKGGE